MARGKPPEQRTLRYKAAVIFALTSLLPLLLFCLALNQKSLLGDWEAMAALGLSALAATGGGVLFVRLVRQLSALAHDFLRLQQGEIDTLGTPQDTHEFAEMARIAESFNKILAELKTNTSELENLVYKLSTLSEVTDLVARIPDIHEVLQLVLHRAMTAVQSQIGSIMLLDSTSQTLRIAAAEGLADEVIAETTIRVGEGIAGKVAQTGEPMLVEDLEHDARIQKVNDPKYDASSFICMPLRARGRITGVLNLSKKSGQRAFSEFDLKFLSTLLGHIGFAVENARLLEEAKEAALKLRHVVHEKSSQLELAQNQLRQSSKFATPHHLIARMSHELRIPLTKALRYAQLMVAKEEDQQMRHVVRRICYETQRATDTVHNLLTFVEQPPLDKHPEELNALLSKALERKAHDLRTGSIEVQTDFAPDLPLLPLDASQMQLAFVHILTNACQAMAEYGTVRILRLRTSQAGQHLRVEIIDTGPGITAEHLQHIFAPFFTTKSHGQGLGLGLNIARDIIRAHQGSLTVKSAENGGTTVVIELPYEAAAFQEPGTLRPA
jgi:signal transduction histidine kinase